MAIKALCGGGPFDRCQLLRVLKHVLPGSTHDLGELVENAGPTALVTVPASFIGKAVMGEAEVSRAIALVGEARKRKSNGFRILALKTGGVNQMPRVMIPPVNPEIQAHQASGQL